MTETTKVTVAEAAERYSAINTKNNPIELSAEQKLIKFIALVLLALATFLVGISLFLWDGQPNGLYSQVWEFSKSIMLLVIGAVVATYLQQSSANS